MPMAVHRKGFTLTEIVAVVGILAVLMGLLTPAISGIRTATRRADAAALVQQLQAACEAYAIEDPRHRLPPGEPGNLIRVGLDASSPRTLDALRGLGVAWASERLGDADAYGRPLLDPWRRPLRYRPDGDLDGVAARPAPRMDWNAKAREPFAYVWSLGKPDRGEADADIAAADRWIYVRSSP